MKINKTSLILLAVVIFLALSTGTWIITKNKRQDFRSSASSKGQVALYFSPRELEVNQGNQFDIDLKIDTGEETISSLNFTLNFDPSLLSLVSVLETATGISQSSQDSEGRLNFEGKSQTTGQLTLASLRFLGNQPGQAEIGLVDSPKIWNEAGKNLLQVKTTTAIIFIR